MNKLLVRPWDLKLQEASFLFCIFLLDQRDVFRLFIASIGIFSAIFVKPAFRNVHRIGKSAANNS
jgi:hypothetical protein